MKTIITATAPTAYQLNSLASFGIDIKKHLNGSYIATQEFYNEDEAKKYLKARAENWYYNTSCNEFELQDMYKDIENGYLTLDAVTANIENKKDE